MNYPTPKAGHLDVHLSCGATAFSGGGVSIKREHTKIGLCVGGVSGAAFAGSIVHLVGTSDDRSIETKFYNDMEAYFSDLAGDEGADFSGAMSVKLPQADIASRVSDVLAGPLEAFSAGADASSVIDREIDEAIELALRRIGVVSAAPKVAVLAGR